MAKAKKASRKPKLVTRLINAGLFALAFMPLLRRLPQMAGPNAQAAVDDLIAIYTAGLSRGAFNATWAAEAYGPVGAAFLLKMLVSMARRKFRF